MDKYFLKYKITKSCFKKLSTDCLFVLRPHTKKNDLTKNIFEQKNVWSLQHFVVWDAIVNDTRLILYSTILPEIIWSTVNESLWKEKNLFKEKSIL